MARSLEPRLRSIEQRRGDDDQRRAQVQEDAALFMSRLHSMAAAFADASVPRDLAAQAHWSPAMHVAWGIFQNSKGMTA